MKIPDTGFLTPKGKRYASYVFRFNRFSCRIPFFGKYFSALSFAAIVAVILKEGENYYGNTRNTKTTLPEM